MDSTMTDASQAALPTPNPPLLQRVTIRAPEFSYAHLQMVIEPPPSPGLSWPPDILTWSQYLTRALTQFLGISGSAIPIDILHLSHDTAWVRIPRTSMSQFGAGVSGYIGSMDGRSIGFRNLGMGEYMMGLVGRAEERNVWKE